MDPYIMNLYKEFCRARDDRGRESAFWLLVEWGKNNFEAIIDALDSEDRSVQRWIISALRNIGDSRAVGPLTEIMEKMDPQDWTEISVLQEAIDHIVDPSDKLHLFRSLKHPHIGFRKDAIGRILDKCSVQEAFPHLVEAIKDEDLDVKAMALYKLSNALGSPSLNKNDVKKWADSGGFDALIHELSASAPGFRAFAVVCLARLEDRRVIEPLIAALKDEDLQVRSDAAWGLEMLTKKDFGQNYNAWQSWWEREGRAKK